MGTLRSQAHIAEYATLRTNIFNEYFENRKYLLESYLHSIARIFEKDAVKASEFLGAFLGKYLELISEEQTYFRKQFTSDEDFKQKFQVFRRENEYDVLVKRIRPWIVGCVEIEELCRCVDIFS